MFRTIIFLYRYVKGDVSYQAAVDDCEASDAILEWQEQNPNIPLGWTETSKALVKRKIEAYLNFLKWHPYVKRDEMYLAMLHSWLNPYRLA